MPIIALMMSGSKPSILLTKFNYTHNLSQYFPVPYERGLTNGLVNRSNTEDLFCRRLLFILIVIVLVFPVSIIMFMYLNDKGSER